MIQSFNNSATEDIFNGRNTKLARKLYPQSLWKKATWKLDQLDSAQTLSSVFCSSWNDIRQTGDDVGEAVYDWGLKCFNKIVDRIGRKYRHWDTAVCR